ncbi:MAG: hypothetical protein Q9222_002820 [Ikaeria aurantiellina]
MTPALQEYMNFKSKSDFLFVVSANGTPLIITAQSAEFVEKARQSSGYTGHAISDPDNDIASNLRKRGAVDVAITQKNGYPHGMAQPAIVLTKTDGTVLYSWAIEPKTMNLGGATGRPILSEVFHNTMAKLNGQRDCSQEQQSSKSGQTSVSGLLKEKIFG